MLFEHTTCGVAGVVPKTLHNVEYLAFYRLA